MLTLTLEQALDDKLVDMSSHYLYIYRDREVIFYVGQANRPRLRLYEHLGIRGARGGGDNVGQIMHDNHPASLSWTVELYTLADCEPFVAEVSTPKELAQYQKQLIRLAERFDYDRLKAAMALAEVALIDHFRPCMNTHAALYYKATIPSRYLEVEYERNREMRREYRKREYP